MNRLTFLRPRTRLAVSAFALTAVTASLLATGGTSYAGLPRVSVEPLVISSANEAPDYATTAFADPWDYSNVEDMRLYGAGRIQGGQLLFKAGDGFPANLVSYIPGAHATGRDGPAARAPCACQRPGDREGTCPGRSPACRTGDPQCRGRAPRVFDGLSRGGAHRGGSLVARAESRAPGPVEAQRSRPRGDRSLPRGTREAVARV